MKRLGFAALLFCILVLTSTTQAQTTEFTYQGQLSSSSAMAIGTFDFEFALFDGGGTQVGPTLTRSGVGVANGIFSVNLDFGSSFPGATRFLEIRVRPAGGGAYTTLSPRQSVTSAPYSVKSLTAGSADTATNSTQLGGVAASQYVQTSDARLTDQRAPAPGSSNYIQNSPTTQPSSSFAISGNGFAGGTLQGNIVSAATQFNLSSFRILGTPGNFSNLTVGQNAGIGITTGTSNVMVGLSAGAAVAGGSNNTIIGVQADVSSPTLTNATAIGHRSQVGASNSLVLGSIAGVNAAFNSTNVGIGTTTPSVRLNVAGGTEATLAGGGFIVAGNPGVAQNLAIDDDEIMVRVAGKTGNLKVNSEGGNVHFMENGVGNVGIGLQFASYRLHVAGGTDVEPTSGGYIVAGLSTATNVAIDNNEIMARNNGTAATLAINADGGNVHLIQSGTGSVGIGTNDPDQKLSVNGNASKTGGQTWAVFSDVRLKNVTGRFTPGLDAIKRLNPIRFAYRPDNALGLADTSPQVGFSAQEVQKVLPEAVTTSTGGYLQLSADPILWTMLNAIKEQQAQIESLQKLNSSQQGQINQLKRIVCSGTKRPGACRGR
jgi:hypothetical protein